MSHLVAMTAPQSAAHTVKRYAGFGILGSDIPTTGDNGGSPVLNDGIVSTSEYHWRLETAPSSGTITFYEDLTFEFSGAANGIHSATYRLWEDGVDQGTATITLQVGQSHTTISVTLADFVGAVSSVSVPRSAISATLANLVGSLSSYPSGTTISTINAVLGDVVGSLASKSAPVTAISSALGNVIGSVYSYQHVPAVTKINTILGSIIGNVKFVGLNSYVRAPDGSGPSVVRATSYRPANVQTSTRH